MGASRDETRGGGKCSPGDLHGHWSSVFDNYFSFRCGDENIMTIF